jgi:hypothetical protein
VPNGAWQPAGVHLLHRPKLPLARERIPDRDRQPRVNDPGDTGLLVHPDAGQLAQQPGRPHR